MKNLLSLIILAIAISSCGGSGETNKQAELDKLLKEQASLNEKIRTLRDEIKTASGDNSGVRLVAINKIDKQPFRHFVEIQAKVDGDESVTISPRTQGTVMSILVSEGTNVSKGQVLATLDDQIIRQTLEEVQTQYNFAKNIYEKQKNLWDQKIGSEVQYLTAKNNMESLEKRLASISEQLDLTRIKSPVNGTIDNVAIKIGQSVMPGIPAMSVVNLTNLKVKGEVGESYAGKIKKGDDVILYFPDLQKEINTKVGFSSKMINALNRTFNVEVPLPSEIAGMSPNMIAVMKIVDYKKDSAIVIPIDLLQSSADGFYLMAATEEGGKMFAHRKPVQTGKNYNGQTEIIAGITETDNIITTGYRDLNEGQEIRTK